MSNGNQINTCGGAHIRGNVQAARDFIGRDQINIQLPLADLDGAAREVRTLVSKLTQGDQESESIRADLLGLMEELRKTHSTIVKAISPLRRIADDPATFAAAFRSVYNDFRDFYDAYDFWEERTRCHKVANIRIRLERHNAAITQSSEWAELRQRLLALSGADIDVIEQYYRPFMQRFNDVMVEIDRLVRASEVVQAITLKQVFADGVASQYDGIKEMLKTMTATIGEIEASLP
jgi:hypothetical protein